MLPEVLTICNIYCGYELYWKLVDTVGQYHITKPIVKLTKNQALICRSASGCNSTGNCLIQLSNIMHPDVYCVVSFSKINFNFLDV